VRPLLERLAVGDILVADGAMGTMLFARGLQPGDCPEKVNLEHPDWLEEIARAYLEAGAEIIQTNTFGGSPLKLAQYGLDARTEEINIAAVRAVRRAVGDRALVSASCGPTGRMLLPYGDVEPDTMREAFERQLGAVLAEGVDIVCVETMTDLNEAKIAVQTARRLSPEVPIMATMTFDPTPRGFFTVMGVSVEQAAHGLAEAGANIVGSNCGNGIENMVKIAAEFRKRTELPLIIQSNAGLPEMRDGQAVYTETPEFMAEKAQQLLDIGISIIGGCCGTTPGHIRALRAVVDARGA
jgi:5-methyltetrahydrofolate--homocysteine methyltransferase